MLRRSSSAPASHSAAVALWSDDQQQAAQRGAVDHVSAANTGPPGSAAPITVQRLAPAADQAHVGIALIKLHHARQFFRPQDIALRRHGDVFAQRQRQAVIEAGAGDRPGARL